MKRDNQRSQAYFGPDGLLDTFKEIKTVSGQILRLNQENMEEASRDAQRTAKDSLLWFGAGSGGHDRPGRLPRLAHHPLHPAADPGPDPVGPGHRPGQPRPGRAGGRQDELGQLAEAFNTMARQLRHYRQTDYARLLRAQRTSQATIDSFPDPVLVVDSEGQVEMANPAAQRLLGVSRQREATSRPPWPGSRPSPASTARRGPAGSAARICPKALTALVLLRPDGQDRSFLPRILPIRDPYGNTLGAAVCCRT